VLGRLCEADPGTFRDTPSVVVDLADDASKATATAWWEELTASGGEGMVVKPTEVVYRGPRGRTQPGIKCRGREYLRIIYGPECTAEHHLSRPRSRRLGHKRSLALREFALGVEALDRFVADEPRYRVQRVRARRPRPREPTGRPTPLNDPGQP
jgi:protein phosphatase